MRLIYIGALTFLLSLSVAKLSQAAPQSQQEPTADAPSGHEEKAADSLFENTVKALQKNFVYRDFREQRLPAIVARYRGLASSAKSLAEQRQVVHDLLSELPASHMGLLSKSTYRHLFDELLNRSKPTFGFELVELDGKHFARNVLEGGPADKAGLKRGDRIKLVHGELPTRSPRLDWRSDDAFLADPPVRRLKCADGDTVKLLVERDWGKTLEIEIQAQPYSAFEAAKASATIFESDDKQIAYIHFWFIHIKGVAKLLKEKLEGDFADCDALVLDLRGRGGNGMAVKTIAEVLSGKRSDWDKPVVALVNRNSRSAKEVLAYLLKTRQIATIVGERTAGAVIPASFKDLGHDTILMYPTFKLPTYTSLLERKGVAPDVFVSEAGPYSAGADPILEAGIAEACRLVPAAATKE